MPPVIIDTGPLVALVDADDRFHQRYVTWLTAAVAQRRQLVIPVPVITEVCYLLSKVAGAKYEALFLEELARTPGSFNLFYPGRKEFGRMAELVRKYGDMPLGYADAAVIVAAEHFKTGEIATVDTRMVGAVRLNDRDAILMVP